MSDLGHEYQPRPWDTAPPPAPLPHTDAPLIGTESGVEAVPPDTYDDGSTEVIGSGYDDSEQHDEGYRPGAQAIGGVAVVDSVESPSDARGRRGPPLPYRRDVALVGERSPAGAERVLEGDLVRPGGDLPPQPERQRGDPSRPFTEGMLGEEKLVVVGGTKVENVKVTNHVVTDMAKKLGEQGGGVILRVRFSPSPDAQTLASAVDSKVATSIELPVTDPHGGPSLINNLTHDQLAETLGTAIAGDDTRAAGAYADIIKSVCGGLDKYHRDQFAKGATDQVGTITLQELSNAVRELRSMLDGDDEDGDEAKIAAEEDFIKAVRDSISPERQKVLAQQFEPLGVGLDEFVQDTSTDTSQRHAVVPPDGYSPTGVTVLGVSIGGHGRRLIGETGILSYAALPMVATVSRWGGRPNAIVVEDADYANPQALDELSRHCENRGIPMVWTVRKPNERNAPLIDAPAHLILRAETRPAEQVSKALGTKPGEEVTGVSESVSAGSSTGAHIGQNTGYRSGAAGDADTGGSTSSTDDARTANWTYTETIVYEVQVLKPGEISGLGPRDVVARRGQEVLGVHDTDSKGFLAPYPPPRPKRSLDAPARISQLAAENDAAMFLARQAAEEAAEAKRIAAAAADAAQNQPAIEAGEQQSSRQYIGTDARTGLPIQPGRPEEVSGLRVRRGAEEQNLKLRYMSEAKTDRAKGKHYDQWRQTYDDYERYARDARRAGETPMVWPAYRKSLLGY